MYKSRLYGKSEAAFVYEIAFSTINRMSEIPIGLCACSSATSDGAVFFFFFLNAYTDSISPNIYLNYNFIVVSVFLVWVCVSHGKVFYYLFYFLIHFVTICVCDTHKIHSLSQLTNLTCRLIVERRIDLSVSGNVQLETGTLADTVFYIEPNIWCIYRTWDEI